MHIQFMFNKIIIKLLKEDKPQLFSQEIENFENSSFFTFGTEKYCTICIKN